MDPNVKDKLIEVIDLFVASAKGGADAIKNSEVVGETCRQIAAYGVWSSGLVLLTSCLSIGVTVVAFRAGGKFWERRRALPKELQNETPENLCFIAVIVCGLFGAIAAPVSAACLLKAAVAPHLYVIEKLRDFL